MKWFASEYRLVGTTRQWTPYR